MVSESIRQCYHIPASNPASGKAACNLKVNDPDPARARLVLDQNIRRSKVSMVEDGSGAVHAQRLTCRRDRAEIVIVAVPVRLVDEVVFGHMLTIHTPDSTLSRPSFHLPANVHHGIHIVSSPVLVETRARHIQSPSGDAAEKEE
jgi:hypothetical protein